MKNFIFLILFSAEAMALEETPLWVQKVRQSHQEGREKQAQDELKALGHVKKSVSSELSVGSKYLAEAVEAVLIIQENDFVPQLLDLVSSPVVEQMLKVQALGAINQVSTDKQLKMVLKTYEKVCPFQGQTPAALKLTCLNLAVKFPKILKVDDLMSLIEDPSYEVRLEAVNKVPLLKKSNDQIVVLKKALSSQPYQLRLASLGIIEQLPKKQRQELSGELKQCLKDSQQPVRDFCRKL